MITQRKFLLRLYEFIHTIHTTINFLRLSSHDFFEVAIFKFIAFSNYQIAINASRQFH
jgi:hypothetical protein